MGLRIDRDRFEAADYERFAQRLEQGLRALRELLARPGFGAGPPSLGVELELFLIDAAGLPLPLNHAVLLETVDPRLTVELDRFNLECNLRPTPLSGRPFEALEREMADAIAEVQRAARVHRGRTALIGILPTLQEEHLQRGAMTDLPRYRALSAGLRQLRRGAFRLNIAGEEPLDVSCDDVTFEGANTSLQVHLRVEPASFARFFNAAQLAAAPTLAVATNSPTFLGRRLWHETRVALFKQSVDDRGPERGRESRAAFGPGWVAEGAYELFERAVALHAPLLPIVDEEEDPLARVRAGGIPGLHELRLHQGTVWHWNRAVYDPAAGGHLRVEMRALPAGPTTTDMVANVALLVGLTVGLAPQVDEWIREFPFALAERNFYRAAQQGLAAELWFPRAAGEPGTTMGAAELVARLLPLARQGLVATGVEPEECERALAPIAGRVASGQTGSRWQRRTLEILDPPLGRRRALAGMLERYLEHAGRDRPVHEWPLERREGHVRMPSVPRGAALPGTPESFLRWLGGPAWLRVPGRDRSRTRVVVTLLHGNEPSGLHAVHDYLRSDAVPAVDAVFLLGAVEAALEPPGFAHRQRPAGRDLNRCFRQSDASPEGELAREILELLRRAQPEALVDLHDNTGRSVPYGVGPSCGEAELGLVSLFADRYVHSDLALGALVEVTASDFPSVVIECGRAGSAAAAAVAREGLARYLAAPRLAAVSTRQLQVSSDPVRVEVRPGVRLALGETPAPGADFTVAAELDRHNFDRLERGHRIGWLAEGAAWPLRAWRADGRDVSHELFEVHAGELRTRAETIPIMITNDPGIALGDCLFYVVRSRQGEPSPKRSLDRSSS